LEDGDRVITAGNVLIDAQAQFHLGGETDEVNAADLATSASASEKGLGGEAHVSTITETPISSSSLPATTPGGMTAMPLAPAGTGTNLAQRPSPAVQGSAARTERMRAIMSPGAELLMRRRGTILAEREARGLTNETSSAMADEHGKMEIAKAEGMDPNPTGALQGVTIQQGQGQSPPPVLVSQLQYQQIQNLILGADAISGALAADNLEQFKTHAARLPALLAPVQAELAAPMHWEKLLEPLAALSKGEPPKTLEEARSRFLPFSTGAVAFVRRIRQDLPGFPKVLIFHCPMAPKPGLWIQIQAPLRNPFFGSKMLSCGEEVKK